MDAALTALSAKTLNDLEKPGDRNLLRSELIATFNSVLGADAVQEIYFTEFNRLFFHYYFRSVVERLRSRPAAAEESHSVDLVEDDSWLVKYEPGTLRAKRVAVVAGMARAQPG